jgi:hypothetical protein
MHTQRYKKGHKDRKIKRTPKKRLDYVPTPDRWANATEADLNGESNVTSRANNSRRPRRSRLTSRFDMVTSLLSLVGRNYKLVVLGIIVLYFVFFYFFPYAKPFGISSGLPLPVPEIPHYPNSPELTWVPLNESNIQTTGLLEMMSVITATVATFETSDDAATVLAFYEDEMPKAHWDPEDTGFIADSENTLHYNVLHQDTIWSRSKRYSFYSVDVAAVPISDQRARVTLLKTHYKLKKDYDLHIP